MNPNQLERCSFLWSEARMIIAAMALLIGGIPVLRFIVPVPALYGLVGLILTLSWIISGAVSCYLLYRWNTGGRMLFGRKVPVDTAAFFINIVSGINLGLAGLIGKNIGMSILSNYPIFVITALMYIAASIYLFKQWKAAGERAFG